MSQSNIRVAIRSRPLVEAQKEKWAPGLEVKGNRILMGTKIFDPDVVFDPDVSQASVFEECLPIIESVKMGRNATIMVYGQTGTGKTHTMLGGPENSGIAFSAIDVLLEYVRERVRNGEAAALSLSMLEIYNERMTDMLAPPPTAGSGITAPSSSSLASAEYQKEVLLINGVPRGTQKIVLSTVEETADLVRKALNRRHVSPTAMNERSSRSHVIVVLDYEWRVSEDTVETASLFLVDLAGSESIKKSQATGKAAAEAGMINKSLLALRNVVLALTTAPPGGRVHVPYRDSRLTELLQDSIGGTARTMLIACISPVARDIEETKSTLEYATKARKIKNSSNDEREKLVLRIRSLEWQLQAQINKNGGTVSISKEDYAEMTTLQTRLDEANLQIDSLSALNTTMGAMSRIEKYEHAENVRALRAAEEERIRCVSFLHMEAQRLDQLKLALRSRFDKLNSAVDGAGAPPSPLLSTTSVPAARAAQSRASSSRGAATIATDEMSSPAAPCDVADDSSCHVSALSRLHSEICNGSVAAPCALLAPHLTEAEKVCRTARDRVDALVAELLSQQAELEATVSAAHNAASNRMTALIQAATNAVQQTFKDMNAAHEGEQRHVMEAIRQHRSEAQALQHQPAVVSSTDFHSVLHDVAAATVMEAQDRINLSTESSQRRDALADVQKELRGLVRDTQRSLNQWRCEMLAAVPQVHLSASVAAAAGAYVGACNQVAQSPLALLSSSSLNTTPQQQNIIALPHRGSGAPTAVQTQRSSALQPVPSVNLPSATTSQHATPTRKRSRSEDRQSNVSGGGGVAIGPAGPPRPRSVLAPPPSASARSTASR